MALTEESWVDGDLSTEPLLYCDREFERIPLASRFMAMPFGRGTTFLVVIVEYHSPIFLFFFFPLALLVVSYIITNFNDCHPFQNFSVIVSRLFLVTCHCHHGI